MQPRVLVPLTASLLVACTSHSSKEIQPTPEHDASPPAAAALDPGTVAWSGSAWRWTHFGDSDGPFQDVGPREVYAGGWSCSYVVVGERQPGEVCCERETQRWCTELREDFVPGVSLASEGTRLFIADYPAISSGARIQAHDLETGKQLWTREAVAIGPQAHSEYYNVVQLRIVGEQLIAYGEEAHGAYIEVMDPQSGALIENLRLEPPRVEWRWDDAAGEPPLAPTLTRSDDSVCRFHIDDEGSADLTCVGPDERSRSHTFDASATSIDRGALAGLGSRLVLVTWNRIANGAHIRSFIDDELVWEREVEGIGPQDHSKYSNLIQVEIQADMVVIRGREAHGRYVDAYALADGALRWSIRWPPG